MGIPIGLFIVALVWNVIWKGIAWWTAARKNHPFWFVLFFIINTMGILEILYFFVFSKMDFSNFQAKNSAPEKKVKKMRKKK